MRGGGCARPGATRAELPGTAALPEAKPDLAPRAGVRHRIGTMRFRICVFAATAVLAALSGCESISDAASGVREKLAAREAPQVRTLAGEQRAVYDAVRRTAEQMGYRMVRGGAAQGRFEAVSGVRAGEHAGSSRQLALKVELGRALDGGTSVAVRITEIIEPDSANRAGQATETPLRDTPQYEVFFRGVEQALKAPEPAPAGAAVRE